MTRLLFIFFVCVLGHAHAASEVRVVSQSVGTDELLLALADPEQIAALSHLARDPQFSAVSREAEGFTLLTRGDAETILRHRPTLVLLTNYSRAELVAQVKRAGVRTWTFDRYATLADAHGALRALATELGGEAPARAERLVAAGEARMREAYAITDKQERTAAVAAAKDAIRAALTDEQREDPSLGTALKKLESAVLRGDVVRNGKRIDGRGLDTVRPIVSA